MGEDEVRPRSRRKRASRCRRSSSVLGKIPRGSRSDPTPNDRVRRPGARLAPDALSPSLPTEFRRPPTPRAPEERRDASDVASEFGPPLASSPEADENDNI